MTLISPIGAMFLGLGNARLHARDTSNDREGGGGVDARFRFRGWLAATAAREILITRDFVTRSNTLATSIVSLFDSRIDTWKCCIQRKIDFSRLG